MRASHRFASFDLAAALSAETPTQSHELTLEELARAYCTAHMDESDWRLRKWITALGSQSAWAITTEQLENAAAAMRRGGFKNSTVNRDLSTLGSIYRWAKERRLSPRGFRSPTLGVTRLKEDIRRIHIEDRAIERLRHNALAFTDRRFGVFVSLLIDTGARKSELLQRRWSEVDLDKRQILAPTTKNGRPRVLFFTESSADLIRRACGKRNPSSLLFEGRVPGQPISYTAAWRTLTQQGGLPQLHMHDLRHVAAARLLKSNQSLGVAAQVLGHDVAVLARRYGHLETEALRKAQEASWAHVGFALKGTEEPD